MLIKIRGKHKNIKIYEKGNGLLITDLNGRYLTVLGTWGALEKELDRINDLQGRRMKAEGWKT